MCTIVCKSTCLAHVQLSKSLNKHTDWASFKTRSVHSCHRRSFDLQPFCIPVADSILLHLQLHTPSGSMYWGMGNADVTRLRLQFKIWSSLCSARKLLAQSAVFVKGKGRTNFGKKFCIGTVVCCVSLCRCLHLNLVCTSLICVRGKLFQTASFWYILRKQLLLSACCFAGKLGY